MKRVALADTPHSSCRAGLLGFTDNHWRKTDIFEMSAPADGIRANVRGVSHNDFTDGTVKSFLKVQKTGATDNGIADVN